MANAPAASHALGVLELLGAHAAPMPAAAIARELDLPRSSIYHLLSVLCSRGFVVHLPEQRRYGLGVAAFELGSAYARQEPLRWIAGTVLGRLVDATTHNGHLAVLHGRDVLYVIEERAAGRDSLVTDVGVRLPGLADRQRPRDARRAARGAGPGAVPGPHRARPPPRGRPGVAHRAPPGARPRALARLRGGGRVGHARVRVGRGRGARPRRASGAPRSRSRSRPRRSTPPAGRRSRRGSPGRRRRSRRGSAGGRCCRRRWPFRGRPAP